MTSSFAAVLDFDRLQPSTTFSEKDWNPATYDKAKGMGDNKAYVYCASKKIAEEEAWKIAKEPETKWELCTSECRLCRVRLARPELILCLVRSLPAYDLYVALSAALLRFPRTPD